MNRELPTGVERWWAGPQKHRAETGSFIAVSDLPKIEQAVEEGYRPVVAALVEAVEKYDKARKRHEAPTAPEGSGQDLWAAESNVGQVLHEAKQLLDSYTEQGGKDLPQAATRPEDSGSVPDSHHGPSGHRASGAGPSSEETHP